MKTCPRCGGFGYLPKYPNPYIILTPAIINSINRNAPKCDKCNGTGEVEEIK